MTPNDHKRFNYAAMALGLALALILLCWALYTAAAADAHEWFSDKVSPMTGGNCCDRQHCHVLELDQWSITSNGFTVIWLDGKTYSMPLDMVRPTEDVQGKAAGCVYSGKLICGFIPLSY